MSNVTVTPYAARAASRALAPVVITRPNNTTAYAAAQLCFGAAANVLVQWPDAGARPGALFSFVMNAINSRSNADPTLGLRWLFFFSLPAAVLGDGAALALSDADIALLTATPNTVTSQQMSFLQLGSFGLNPGAGILGRRTSNSGVSLGLNFGGLLTVPAGATGPLWGLPFTSDAYTPLALETVTLYAWCN